MYRILIVDDEIAIVMGMEKILSEWENAELDIYKAQGAAEALRIAQNGQVDILLADIHLPGMNGLELGRQIAAYNPSCKIIYLTGFSSFDYIYEAMQRVGTQYLLKAESDRKILGAVQKAIDMLEEERREQVVQAQIRLEQKKSSALMKKDVLAALLDTECPPAQRQGLFETWKLSLRSSGPIYVFTGFISGLQPQKDPWRSMEDLYRVKLLVDEKLETFFCVESLVWEEKVLVWLLQPARGKAVPNLRRYFQMTAEEVQRVIEQLTQKVFSVSFCAEGLPIEALAESFHVFVRRMRQLGEPSVPMIYDWIDLEKEEEQYEQEVMLKKLEEYISAHLSEDISLTRLAEVIHFNPSYLSRFYKKMRGRNLSEYICEVRIEKAKWMLQKTEKRISDISAALGFDTHSAFCAFFKKQVGCSPAQYRKRY